MTRAETESAAPQDSFLVLPRSLLWFFTVKMVGIGLFCFHLFFFHRPRHNEASGPGMGGGGSERVKNPTLVFPTLTAAVGRLHHRGAAAGSLDDNNS